jgi:hypothetical protein
MRRKVICGLTLLAALSAAVWIAAPAESAGVSTKPHALKLLINGKKLTITRFGGLTSTTPSRFRACAWSRDGREA